MLRFFVTLSDIVIILGIPFLLIYIMVAFPGWNWDITAWSSKTRGGFLTVWMIISFMTWILRD